MKKLALLILSFILFSSSVMAKDIRFVQITDVRYSKNSEENILAKVIADVNKESGVDFVIFTGDNINRPNPDDLKAFINEAKKLNCPFYVAVGDRDVNKRKELSKKQYASFVKKYARHYKPSTTNYVFEKQGVVFIVADGSKDVIPNTIGYYKDEVLEWIDANLEVYKKKPVVILQHFPLIPPCERETYNTYKAENYLNMLKNHKNVKAVIAGHFGVNKEETVDGIVHISTAPVPNYRVIDILNIESEPVIWAQVKKAE